MATQSQDGWDFPIFNETLANKSRSMMAVNPNASAVTFHPFSRLPTEIRLKIWKESLEMDHVGRFISLTISQTLYPEPLKPMTSARVARRIARDMENRLLDAVDGDDVLPSGAFKTTKNHLGNFISGAPYRITVSPMVSSVEPWSSRSLRRVNREANTAYCELYRLSIPLLSGWTRPPPTTTSKDGSGDHSIPSEDMLEQMKEAVESQTYACFAAAYGLDGFRHPEELRLRLHPETDIVEVHLQEGPGSPHSGTVLSFLYDSWAWDPKGVGICRLVMGRRDTYFGPGTHQDQRLLTDWWSHRVGAGGWWDDLPEEVKRGFTQYFSGFNGKSERHIFFAAINYPIREARTLVRHNLPRPAEVKVANPNPDVPKVHMTPPRRAMPLVPHPARSSPNGMPGSPSNQAVGLAAVYDEDPRPIELDGMWTYGVPIIGYGSLRDPRHIVSQWLRLVSRLTGESTDQSIKAVRYLVGCWPLERSTRQDIRKEFFRRVRDHDWYSWEQTYQMRVRNEIPDFDVRDASCPPPPTTGVQDVAGVWIFGPDALGDIPDQFASGSVHVLDLAKHRPGLMVFDMV